MSESPEERRERLVAALRGEAGTRRGAEYALDALLDALEPPVADMVRRGVIEFQGSVGRGYAPRSER